MAGAVKDKTKKVKNRLSNRLRDDTLESYMRIHTTSFAPNLSYLSGELQVQKRKKT